jgi:hypothetical protein
MPALITNRDGSPHIHTWAATGSGAPGVNRDRYVCLDPDCFTAQSRKDLVGKRSICTQCRKTEILLTHSDLRRAKPRCFACSNTQAAKETRKIRERLAEMGIE